MNKNIFLIILIFNINVGAQNVGGIFTYKKDFSEFHLKSTSKDSLQQNKINDLIKDLYENANFLEFTLKVKNNESLFFAENKMDIENQSMKSALSLGDTKGIFYMDIVSKEILNNKESYGELFIIQSSLNDRIWTITNENKKIGEYNCFKATSLKTVENPKGIFKHVVEAWFTPDIPLNFGPAGYGGLPGLIVELKYQNIRFILSKIEINKEDEIEIKKPTKGKLVSPKEFNEIGKEMTKYYRRN